MIEPVAFPELIIGTAGPIGVDMGAISTTIQECLKALQYTSHEIKLTEEMLRIQILEAGTPTDQGKAAEYSWKMDYANALRKKYNLSDALARLAIFRIIEIRTTVRSVQSPSETGDEDKRNKTAAALTKTAFIIRQIKHPDEVKLLRQVYGKQFILVSAYATEAKRRRKLFEDIRTTEPTQAKHSDLEHKAIALIERDSSETGEKLGQQLRDAFHLADVFVDGLSLDEMKKGLSRFFTAFFGKTDITPNRDEYGMYAAKSASLRSGDLARQVGASIFSARGEMITQGCNEVPKAGGGTYWDGEVPDFRDIKKGFDPNDKQKKEILRDIVERMRIAGHLSETTVASGNDSAIVEALIKKVEEDSAEDNGALRDSWLMDLTEFGRVVHAEMCAICDAARTGKTVENATLFCTTFPCHNCTKHIIAAGITRVVYMEPYPKSRAKELHEDEIELDGESDSRAVSFVPFMGISPLRYREIFQKGRRKSNEGGATTWINGQPQPMLDMLFPSYIDRSELWAVAPLAGDLSRLDQVSSSEGL